MMTYGFMGTGNMGGALAKAVCQVVDPAQVLLANRTMEKASALAQTLGATCATNAQIAQTADCILLGVKPHLMGGMLAEINPILAQRTTPFVLVSMAAGLSLAQLDELSGSAGYPILRIMPNTPCAIGEGIILYTANAGVSPQVMETFLQAFAHAGLLSQIEESLLDAGAVVAGCAPAFVDLFLEALADGGVCCGLPRQQAMDLACAMLAGSAKLVAQSGQHPGACKDAVCSPKGSTIEGVRALEAHGFRSAVIEAVMASYAKMNKLA